MLHFQAYDDTSRTILRGPLGGIFFLLKAAHGRQWSEFQLRAYCARSQATSLPKYGQNDFDWMNFINLHNLFSKPLFFLRRNHKKLSLD